MSVRLALILACSAASADGAGVAQTRPGSEQFYATQALPGLIAAREAAAKARAMLDRRSAEDRATIARLRGQTRSSLAEHRQVQAH